MTSFNYSALVSNYDPHKKSYWIKDLTSFQYGLERLTNLFKFPSSKTLCSKADNNGPYNKPNYSNFERLMTESPIVLLS